MRLRSFGRAGLAGIGVVLSGMAPSHGANLSSFAQHVRSFQLPNGMKFAVMERHEAPLLTVHMIVKAGPLDEPEGQTGISRLFPRMFPNGGELGTRNPAGEKAALARVEQAYETWKKLEAQKPPADSYDVSKARVEFQMAMESAALFGSQGFAFRALEDAGAMTIEARFDADVTHYLATLPPQSAETWFKLTSDWLRKPPARRFYEERNAWQEEAAKTAQGSPQAAIEDAILAAAFGTSGYGRKASVVHDGAQLRAAHFDAFASAFYVPANTVVAIAGDVEAGAIQRLAETYFGPIARAKVPTGPAPEPLRFDSDRIAPANGVPPQALPVVVAWPRPPASSPDDAVFDVIWGILTTGHDALLPQTFSSEHVAAQASIVPNFPGHRAWSLFAVSAFPVGQVTRPAVEDAITKAMSKLAAAPVEPARLNRVKTALRTQLSSETESITGVCHLLARFLSAGGSPAAIGEAEQRIMAVSAEDVVRVAKAYLPAKGRLLVRPGEGGGAR